MQTANYTPGQFADIAGIEKNLRISQIRGVHVTQDGQRITLLLTATDERIADKRDLAPYDHGNNHAVDAYTNIDGVEMFAGTPGIQSNPASASLRQGFKGLMARESKSVLACGRPEGQVAYYLYANTQAQPVDLKGTLGFAEVAFAPKPRGFVAREPNAGRLWFLSYDQAKAGKITRSEWTSSNAIEGVKAVQSLPARIQSTRAVLCQITDMSGRTGSVLLNVAGIQQGQVATVMSELGTDDVAFRCFANADIAIVETGAQAQRLKPRTTYQVPTTQLSTMFGKAGQALVEAAA